MDKNFPVIIEQDEEGKYIVTCPIFEGCYSQGNTFEEAMKNIREAIELCLEEGYEKNALKTVLIGNVVVSL